MIQILPHPIEGHNIVAVSRYRNLQNQTSPKGRMVTPEDSIPIPPERRKLLAERQRYWLRRISKRQGFHPEDPGRCAHHAFAGILAGRDIGIHLMIQAGTVQWLCTIDEQGPLYFGYEWESDSALSQKSISIGNLPSVHIWLASLVPAPFLIDFSTEYLPLGCPYRWTEALPPTITWISTEGSFRPASYTPIEDATLYAMSAMSMLFRDLE